MRSRPSPTYSGWASQYQNGSSKGGPEEWERGWGTRGSRGRFRDSFVPVCVRSIALAAKVQASRTCMSILCCSLFGCCCVSTAYHFTSSLGGAGSHLSPFTLWICVRETQDHTRTHARTRVHPTHRALCDQCLSSHVRFRPPGGGLHPPGLPLTIL